MLHWQLFILAILFFVRRGFLLSVLENPQLQLRVLRLFEAIARLKITAGVFIIM